MRTVLVVDDASDCAVILEVALQGLRDVTVERAASAEAAWSFLERSAVAAVLTDLQLPGMTGIELTERLRAEERFRGMPVIVVSAASDAGAGARALGAGADAFFGKPFSPAAVCRKLQELWEDHANS
ncbi:MAG: response regulator [Acidobacteriota bacterium]